MAADSQLLESFLHRDHRVLGRRLAPLSLRRLMLLELVQSPWIYGGPVSWPSLILSVWTCTRPWHGWRAPTTLETLWLRLTTPAAQLKAEAAKFETYVADYWAPPQMWTKPRKPGENKKPSKLPWQMKVAGSLAAATGWDPEAIWNLPAGEALWWAISIASYEGSEPDLITDEERRLIAKHKALKRQVVHHG